METPKVIRAFIVKTGGERVPVEPTPEHYERALAILNEAFPHDPMTKFFAIEERRKDFMAKILPAYLRGKDLEVYLYEGDLGVAIVVDVPTAAAPKAGEPAGSDPVVDGVVHPLRMGDWGRFCYESNSGKALFSSTRGGFSMVGFLGVRPEAQGKGIGSSLLDALIEDAHARGVPAYLEATSEGSARLYARKGFKEIRRVDFGNPPSPDSFNIIVMATDVAN